MFLSLLNSSSLYSSFCHVNVLFCLIICDRFNDAAIIFMLKLIQLFKEIGSAKALYCITKMSRIKI